jgi:hypothetical protein
MAGLSFKTNADMLSRAWIKRAEALKPTMAVATKNATLTLYAKAKELMNELIYDKPVPTRAETQSGRSARAEAGGRVFKPRKNFTTKKGTANREGAKPAWKRTGNLKRSERWKVVSAYLGIVYNDAEYARARHDMGKPGRRKTRYPAPWRDAAIDACRAIVREIYRKAMRAAILAGKVSGPDGH